MHNLIKKAYDKLFNNTATYGKQGSEIEQVAIIRVGLYIVIEIVTALLLGITKIPDGEWPTKKIVFVAIVLGLHVINCIVFFYRHYHRYWKHEKKTSTEAKPCETSKS